MTHIVCVKWGQLYGPEYVNHLYRAIERNTTLDFDFTCFTDDFDGIDTEIACRGIPVKLDGWWNKMYLFSNDLGITDRILYFDLDTVITGNIDKMLQFNDEFAILRDLYRARKSPQATQFGSGVMAWQGGQFHQVWSDFYKNFATNQKHGGGDQVYLQGVIPVDKVVFWQDYMPDGQIISYKVHVRDIPEPKNVLPPEAKVVNFHGVPRCHFPEVRDLDWMKEHWR
jgi:hypothetical protein